MTSSALLLQVKQGAVRQQRADGSIHEAFSVELAGPVLPSTLHSLHSLFASTQGDFVSSCSVQETTTPFNLATPGNDRTMAQYLEQHCGQQVDMETLSAADLQVNLKHKALPVQISDVNNGRQAIKELKYHNGAYSWS